jgi:hypothetical protein
MSRLRRNPFNHTNGRSIRYDHGWHHRSHATVTRWGVSCIGMSVMATLFLTSFGLMFLHSPWVNTTTIKTQKAQLSSIVKATPAETTTTYLRSPAGDKLTNESLGTPKTEIHYTESKDPMERDDAESEDRARLGVPPTEKYETESKELVERDGAESDDQTRLGIPTTERYDAESKDQMVSADAAESEDRARLGIPTTEKYDAESEGHAERDDAESEGLGIPPTKKYDAESKDPMETEDAESEGLGIPLTEKYDAESKDQVERADAESEDRARLGVPPTEKYDAESKDPMARDDSESEDLGIPLTEKYDAESNHQVEIAESEDRARLGVPQTEKYDADPMARDDAASEDLGIPLTEKYDTEAKELVESDDAESEDRAHRGIPTTEMYDADSGGQVEGDDAESEDRARLGIPDVEKHDTDSKDQVERDVAESKDQVDADFASGDTAGVTGKYSERDGTTTLDEDNDRSKSNVGQRNRYSDDDKLENVTETSAKEAAASGDVNNEAEPNAEVIRMNKSDDNFVQEKADRDEPEKEFSDYAAYDSTESAELRTKKKRDDGYDDTTTEADEAESAPSDNLATSRKEPDAEDADSQVRSEVLDSDDSVDNVQLTTTKKQNSVDKDYNVRSEDVRITTTDDGVKASTYPDDRENGADTVVRVTVISDTKAVARKAAQQGTKDSSIIVDDGNALMGKELKVKVVNSSYSLKKKDLTASEATPSNNKMDAQSALDSKGTSSKRRVVDSKDGKVSSPARRNSKVKDLVYNSSGKNDVIVLKAPSDLDSEATRDGKYAASAIEDLETAEGVVNLSALASKVGKVPTMKSRAARTDDEDIEVKERKSAATTKSATVDYSVQGDNDETQEDIKESLDIREDGEVAATTGRQGADKKPVKEAAVMAHAKDDESHESQKLLKMLQHSDDDAVSGEDKNQDKDVSTVNRLRLGESDPIAVARRDMKKLE